VILHTFYVGNVQPNFGIRIRKLRLDRGLSQRKLAELVGISEEQISNIERGKSWIGELSFGLLAKALGVTQNALTDYSENDAFIKAGGLSRRAPREPAMLIVRRKREVLVQIPRKRR
jgi:transcriptional regulator with XRE-family HTH domain